MSYFELALEQEKLDKEIAGNVTELFSEGGLPIDFYSKKKVALLVELGELANELRFFKYWSKDQEPRIHAQCSACYGKGKLKLSYNKVSRKCPVCSGTGKDRYRNPALEEYVDCLHFILSVGLDIKGKGKLKGLLDRATPLHYNNLDTQFSQLFYEISSGLTSKYDLIINYFFGLGELIGFTKEQVIDAYYRKNKINHQRQKELY